MTHASTAGSQLEVPDDLVRLSVGIEDVADLLGDLEQALRVGADRNADAVTARFISASAVGYSSTQLPLAISVGAGMHPAPAAIVETQQRAEAVHGVQQRHDGRGRRRRRLAGRTAPTAVPRGPGQRGPGWSAATRRRRLNRLADSGSAGSDPVARGAVRRLLRDLAQLRHRAAVASGRWCSSRNAGSTTGSSGPPPRAPPGGLTRPVRRGRRAGSGTHRRGRAARAAPAPARGGRVQARAAPTRCRAAGEEVLGDLRHRTDRNGRRVAASGVVRLRADERDLHRCCRWAPCTSPCRRPCCRAARRRAASWASRPRARRR